MYCKKYTGTIRRVLCREVHYTVYCVLLIFGIVHYGRFHCNIHFKLIVHTVRDCPATYG